MKKKIKDLTLEEVKKLCIKFRCVNCPLDGIACNISFVQLCMDDDLEEEIEVEDDE